MSGMQKWYDLKEELKDLTERMNNLRVTAFKEICLELFAQRPELVSFSWTQYTPYFNDGSSCVFGTSFDYGMDVVSTIKDSMLRPVEQEDGTFLYEEFWFNNNSVESWAKSLFLSIIDILDNFSDDDFQQLFGDHVRVTVTREKVLVDNYNHD